MSNASSSLSGSRAQARRDAGVARDRADQDRSRADLGAGEDDAVAKLHALAEARAVADHDGPRQAHALSELDVAPDPDGAVHLGVQRKGAGAREHDARAHLASLDLQAQLAAQRVEGPLPQLGQRPHVVPVLPHLVDEEGDVVLEQRREDVVRPVHERLLREVVEDLRLEDVDAAISEIRERFVGLGLLLKAGDAAFAVVQHDAVLARVAPPA